MVIAVQEYSAAYEAHQRAHSMSCEIGDVRLTGVTLCNMAVTAQNLQRSPDAYAHLKEAVKQAEAVNEDYVISIALPLLITQCENLGFTEERELWLERERQHMSTRQP
eukprot:TRINITY_DN10558_c0_g1_i1.p2 TRINITY_DN10558_c0_g1~~TRINITY_DN10558_c0_g1_i1.p2  ORF type:complete len:108 (+),score=19.92 TRINITY_DN10558_c0_g1_i1:466-789(+)